MYESGYDYGLAVSTDSNRIQSNRKVRSFIVAHKNPNFIYEATSTFLYIKRFVFKPIFKGVISLLNFPGDEKKILRDCSRTFVQFVAFQRRQFQQRNVIISVGRMKNLQTVTNVPFS
jgi:hypothetical protein